MINQSVEAGVVLPEDEQTPAQKVERASLLTQLAQALVSIDFNSRLVIGLAEQIAKHDSTQPVRVKSAARAYLGITHETPRYQARAADPLTSYGFSKLIQEATTSSGVALSKAREKEIRILINSYSSMGDF